MYRSDNLRSLFYDLLFDFFFFLGSKVPGRKRFRKFSCILLWQLNILRLSDCIGQLRIVSYSLGMGHKTLFKNNIRKKNFKLKFKRQRNRFSIFQTLEIKIKSRVIWSLNIDLSRQWLNPLKRESGNTRIIKLKKSIKSLTWLQRYGNQNKFSTAALYTWQLMPAYT